MAAFVLFRANPTLSKQEAETRLSSIRQAAARMEMVPGSVFTELSLVNKELTAAVTFQAEPGTRIVLKSRDDFLKRAQDTMYDPFNRFIGRWVCRLEAHGFEIVTIGHVFGAG